MSETLIKPPAADLLEQVRKMAILTAMEAAQVRRLYVNLDWEKGRRIARISTDFDILPAAIAATADHVAKAATAALDAEYPWITQAIGFVEITSITTDILMHACPQERI